MNKHLIYSLIASAALVLTACDESWDRGSDSEGKFTPVVQLDASHVGDKAKAPSRAVAVTTGDLRLELTSSTGATYTWNSIDEFDNTATFPVGAYTLKAYYGDGSEGFDLPHYSGSTSFSIRENETTPVALTASLANAMVTLKYTEAFTSYFTAYSTDLLTALGNTVTIAADETRQAYVSAGAVTVKVNVTKPGGQKASYDAKTFAAEARHHYNITLDVNEGGVGNAELILTFDDQMQQEEVVIDLSADLTNTPAPTLVTTFDASATMDIVAGMMPADPVKYTMIARGGLAKVNLATTSVSLLEQGWPAEIDLLGATADQRNTMAALGLTEVGIWKNPGTMAVLDITEVISKIKYITGVSNESSFTLTVTDRLGQTSEPVAFTVSVEKMHIEIANPGSLLPETSTMELDLEYNGTDPKDVDVEYKNERGEWDKVEKEAVTTRSRLVSVYHLTLAGIPVDIDVLHLRANHRSSGTTSTAVLTVNRVQSPHALVVDAGQRNVFSTHATIEVVNNDDKTPFAQAAAEGTLRMSTDDGKTYKEYKATVDGASLYIEGLQPATRYTAVLLYDGLLCRRVTFTTEGALQIPNGNLNADATISGKGNNWENYVFETWGTNNALTTSQGSDFGYCRVSGTIPTDESQDGNAAEIRTIGWGSGNSALTGVRGACKYLDAGLLHLGATRTIRPAGYSNISGSLETTDLDCGIAHNSRPEALTFYYKYQAKNSADKGEALVQILDNAGSVIVEKKVDLTAQGSYTKLTLSLEYPALAPKAAKIYVRFLSTNVGTALTKDANWLNGPGFGNLSRGTYMGSKLWIDEVLLEY